jgi:hypothetical protein
MACGSVYSSEHLLHVPTFLHSERQVPGTRQEGLDIDEPGTHGFPGVDPISFAAGRTLREDQIVNLETPGDVQAIALGRERSSTPLLRFRGPRR